MLYTWCLIRHNSLLNGDCGGDEELKDACMFNLRVGLKIGGVVLCVGCYGMLSLQIRMGWRRFCFTFDLMHEMWRTISWARSLFSITVWYISWACNDDVLSRCWDLEAVEMRWWVLLIKWRVLRGKWRGLVCFRSMWIIRLWGRWGRRFSQVIH